MRHILFLIEFDGTDFHGWQVQLGDRTVQETLNVTLNQFTGEKHVLRASSRTDAGVHARGLPVLFTTETDLPLRAFLHGLNNELPWDLAIRAAVEVDESFHVRRSSLGKIYRYSIWNTNQRSPLRERRAWHVPLALDIDAMNRAAEALVGQHDFSSFRAASCQSKSTIRELTRIAVEGQAGGEVSITVEGNAFLQYMVRIIVGTLVEVGRGHQSKEWPGELLALRDRKVSGPTAPAKGLCLERVNYDPSPFHD